jgi:hypothetical protein
VLTLQRTTARHFDGNLLWHPAPGMPLVHIRTEGSVG